MREGFDRANKYVTDATAGDQGVHGSVQLRTCMMSYCIHYTQLPMSTYLHTDILIVSQIRSINQEVAKRFSRNSNADGRQADRQGCSSIPRRK